MFFLATLCLQFAALAVIAGRPLPQVFPDGRGMRHEHHVSAMPIFFYKEEKAIAPPSGADSTLMKSRPAPESSVEPKSSAEQEGNAQAEAVADHASAGEGQGLAPFPSWSMNSMSSGSVGFHHRITNALPIFTPDPPILHGKFPEVVRGEDVILEVIINEQGSIADTRVLRPVGYGVEDSIMQTLRYWIFVPAKINGVPVASRRQLRFHFPG